MTATDILFETNNEEVTIFTKIEQLYTFIDAITDLYLILNSRREVIYANKALYDFIGKEPSAELSGKKPGDFFHCLHAVESSDGCGTTETCPTCGAFQAIALSLAGNHANRECWIAKHGSGDALDFRVWTTPYKIGEEVYSILALTDISNEKRRQALERIFYHDILNTAVGLHGLAGLLVDSPDDVDEYKEIIYGLSEKLIDEINSQRMLSAAEDNELQPDFHDYMSLEFLSEIISSYKKYYLVSNKTIQVDSAASNIKIKTDKTLLRRVLLNMIKNAV